jgi:hypothetical protein
MITIPQTDEERQQQGLPPIGQPMFAPGMGAQPAPGSPIVQAAGQNAASPAPAMAIPASTPAPAMPVPQKSATEQLWQKAGNVQNPFARFLAKTGAGILRGADIGAEALAPRLAMAIPGSELRTDIGNANARNQALKTYEAQTQRENADVKPAIEQGKEEAKHEDVAAQQEGAANRTAATQAGAGERTAETNATREQIAADKPEQARQDAYHEWQASHPNGTYDDFLKDTQQYKGTPQHMTGMGAYALMRIIDAASRVDPRLEPLIPSLVKELGIDVPGGLNLSGPPAGQPRNEEGQPIGTGMPEAPTTATRTRGQFAESGVTDQVPGLKQEINSLRGQLGPAQGRWNEFMTGKVGADNPAFKGLRTGLQNLATAWMRLHANSDAARQEFESALSRAQSPDDLIATLDSIDKQARDYVRQGKGNQPSAGGQGPKAAPALPKGAIAGTLNGKHGYVLNGKFHAD